MFFSKEDRDLLQTLYALFYTHQNEVSAHSVKSLKGLKIIEDELRYMMKKLENIELFMEDADTINRCIEEKEKNIYHKNLQKLLDIQDKLQREYGIDVELGKNSIEFQIMGNVSFERLLCLEDNEIRGSKFIITWKD